MDKVEGRKEGGKARVDNLEDGGGGEKSPVFVWKMYIFPLPSSSLPALN